MSFHICLSHPLFFTMNYEEIKLSVAKKDTMYPWTCFLPSSTAFAPRTPNNSRQRRDTTNLWESRLEVVIFVVELEGFHDASKKKTAYIDFNFKRMIEDPPSSLLKALAQHFFKHEWSTPMFCSTSFFSIWKSLHGSVNSIAVGGSSTHLRHGLEKRRRRTIPWRVEFQLRCPLQGMRFQGKTKETLGYDLSPSGWIIRYEFLFVKYDWKRWRALLNFSSFPWKWRSEWCVYVAHLQLISHNFKRHVCMK